VSTNPQVDPRLNGRSSHGPSFVESPAVVHSPCLIDLAPMFKNIEQNLTMQRHLSQVHDETRPNIAWC
jgi:hypothetical protein